MISVCMTGCMNRKNTATQSDCNQWRLGLSVAVLGVATVEVALAVSLGYVWRLKELGKKGGCNRSPKHGRSQTGFRGLTRICSLMGAGREVGGGSERARKRCVGSVACTRALPHGGA